MQLQFKFLFALLLTGLISCKKDSVTTGTNSAESAPDSVVVTEFTPQPVLNTVNYYTMGGFGGGFAIPHPSDSISNMELDLDNDGITDFIITAEQYYHFLSASSPEVNYNYYMKIEGTNSNNKIAITGTSLNPAKQFQLHEEIFYGNNWGSNAYLSYSCHDNMNGGSVTLDNDQYLGLKMKTNSNEIVYGWLLVNKTQFVLTLISSGLNRTPNNSILAGQQ